MARRALGACLLLLGLNTSTILAQDTKADRETRHTNITTYVELLRSDVRAQKVAILTELMAFSEAEDAAFWPVYREYEGELTALNDEKIRGIQEFTAQHASMTAEQADALASKALDLETRRTALKQKYYARVKAATSPTVAARFLQIENQILMIIDLQIAASLPIIQ